MITKIMSGMGSDANGDGKMLAAMATQIPILLLEIELYLNSKRNGCLTFYKSSALFMI